MNIFYDYDKETNFGQITVCDKEGEKVSVINIEKIEEHYFKQLFIINKYSNHLRNTFEYGTL